MKKILLILILGFTCSSLYSQREFYNWTFGDKCGLTFNTPDIEPKVFGSSITTREGCATISDRDGNLLFYTNGVNVFDKEHNLMSNGQGLHGDNSSSESSIIVKQPGNKNIYYIFTVGAIEYPNSGGLYYSIVDMSLNNNLGEVVQKNIKINSFAIERLCSVKNYLGNSFWIICYNFNDYNFYAYSLSSQGMNPIGIKSPSLVDDSRGYYMKVNKTGDMLAIARGIYGGVNIYQFYSNTGMIKLKYNLPVEYSYFYGCEFSNDGSKLYVSNFWSGLSKSSFIAQFDLSSDDESTILNSYTIIIDIGKNFSFGALQIAPNNKIYATIENSNYLSVINKPDQIGSNCDFQLNSIKLTGITKLGLPNFTTPVCSFSDTGFESHLPDSLAVCKGDTIIVGNDEDPQFIYSWQPSILFDNPEKSKTKVTLNNNVILYQLVTNKISGCLFVDSIVVLVDTNKLSIHGKTEFCRNDSSYLFIDDEFKNIKWSTGDTNHGVWILDSGTITVSAENKNGCKLYDSVVIKIILLPNSSINIDTLFCRDNSPIYKLSLSDTNLFINRWSNGDSSKSIDASVPGNYWVTFNNSSGCAGYSEIDIKQDTSKIQIYGNHELCEDDSTQLWVDNIFPDAEWSDGTIGQGIIVKSPGKYYVKYETKFGCFLYDTVEVKLNPQIKSHIKIIGNLCVNDFDKVELKLIDSTLTIIEWSTGESANRIIVNDTGKYWVKYQNQFGCIYFDTTNVITIPSPKAGIEQFGDFCLNSQNKVVLKISDTTLNVIKWSTGETSKSIFIKDTGLFWVDYSNESGCTARSEITVINKTLGTIDKPAKIFDKICKGSLFSPVISVVNSDLGDILIDSVYLSSKDQFALKLYDPNQSHLPFNHGDSVKIRLSYLPTASGDYFDTLHLVFADPCRGEFLIPLWFITDPALIEIGSVDTLVNFGDKVCLPVIGRYLCDDADNMTTTYKIILKINASLFVPDHVSKGKIDSIWKRDGFYFIEISDSNCIFTNISQTINYLCGSFYKGDVPGSDIEIVDMDFDNGADTSSANGSIRGEICQFGLRGIELFDLNTLIVIPNPAIDQIKLNIINIDTGEIDFDIINSVGKIVSTWTINKSESDSDKFELSKEINEFGSGVYLVRMRSSSGITTGLFMVVK